MSDDLIAFDRFWHADPGRGSACYKPSLDAWRAATELYKVGSQRCETCRHWTPNSRSITGKCRVLKVHHGEIVFNIAQDFGQFTTASGFSCAHWEER